MDDSISRQAAIDALTDDLSYYGSGDERAFGMSRAIGIIEKLPSAQPQRIKGRWIHDGYDISHGVDWMHCSVCGQREPYVPAAMTNYCPTCGADLRSEIEQSTGNS